MLSIIGAPPEDAQVGAGLVEGADRLLAMEDLQDALSPLIEAGRVRADHPGPWVSVFEKADEACSARLRKAAEPLVRTFRRSAGPDRRKAPYFAGGISPEHIPAYLQHDWFQSCFSAFTGLTPKILRRTAAVRLVQMVAGGSLGDAAIFLGVNPSRLQYTRATDVHRWARTQQDPLAFERALRTLAEQIESLPAPIDYQHRRQALSGWSLDPNTWEELNSRLPPTRGPKQPVLDDRKRQAASVYVWAHITQGEHLFAPRPIEESQPEAVQRAWAARRNTTWFQLTRPDGSPHYAALARILSEYAESLASSVDAAGCGADSLATASRRPLLKGSLSDLPSA
ncbi:hypothetical protein [Streptomyces fagopyri]|nr:hypothetical protein [Streptomyces fagopyri]